MLKSQTVNKKVNIREKVSDSAGMVNREMPFSLKERGNPDEYQTIRLNTGCIYAKQWKIFELFGSSLDE